jgi:hypothetical protein
MVKGVSRVKRLLAVFLVVLALGVAGVALADGGHATGGDVYGDTGGAATE